mgnify:CR=1 FL=1
MLKLQKMKASYWEEKGIYYRTNTFEPGRPTLVFIHGLTGSSSSWWPYEKIFENKYNILNYDIRGHGKSKKFTNYADYAIKKFAEDLHDLTTHIKLSKFVLIGHSMGTLIVAEYEKLYADDVLGLIFLSPIFGLEKSFIGKISRPILQLSKILDFFPFSPKSGHHIDYTKFLNTTDWSAKRIFFDSRNTTLRIHLYCLKQFFFSREKHVLEKIKVPTLIVHGIKDTISKVDNAVALSKKIKNSELVLIPETNHFFVLNNLRETVRVIESFMGKNKKNLLY